LDNGSRLGHSDNRLLAALPRELFELMQHDFKQISLLQGQAIYEPGEQIDQIYFPQSGMISLLVVGKDGGAIETATIGREGAVGLHGAIGKRASFTRATIQISGKFSVHPLRRLRAICAEPCTGARLDSALYRSSLGRSPTDRGVQCRS